MNSQPDLTESLIKRQQINKYSRWMYNNFKRYIGKRVLDIGSGTGNIINFFINNCERVVATEIFPGELEYIKERFIANNLECKIFDISKGDIEELKNYLFDTITCINVLEHIEDDFKAVSNMKDIIITGGRIIILVPAISKAYGTMDKACGHFRRYDKGDLEKIADTLRLKVIYNKYMNPLGLIPWIIKGKIQKKEATFSDSLDEKSSFIYNIASGILENAEKLIKAPFGISQIVVFEKEQAIHE